MKAVASLTDLPAEVTVTTVTAATSSTCLDRERRNEAPLLDALITPLKAVAPGPNNRQTGRGEGRGVQDS
jgi:hypothetical protein